MANGQEVAAPAAARRTKPASAPPVILLTGFEPFGPNKPPNPSWEGIKKLDGRTWRGHKLVARQFKVIWGEPLAQLNKLIDELHPVAVFSFGQGGGYALEHVPETPAAPSPTTPATSRRPRKSSPAVLLS